MYLNGKIVLYPCVGEIVWEHIEKDEKNFEKMKRALISNKKFFQYVYAKCYPDNYSLFEKRRIDVNFYSPSKLERQKKIFLQPATA